MKDIKTKFKEKLAQSDLKDLDNDIYSGVYLFFSFDLVNSTFFKARYRNKWQEVFTRFYSFIEKELSEKYKQISLWKYIGDEVLMYLKLSSLEDLYDAPPKTISVMNDVTKQLYKEIPEAKKLIYIKSTLWIADVQFQNRGDIEEKPVESDNNIIFFTGNAPVWLSASQNIDFLGPDIDLGFRLSAYTEKSKLLVSSEIAYILDRKNGEIGVSSREYSYSPNNTLKYITLKELKGIWDGRKYPIIWFDEDWSKDPYEYDEYAESEFVKIIKDDMDLDINIQKVFEDVDKVQQMEEIINKIDLEKNVTERDVVNFNVPQERLAEIHCAAICFNSKKEMLIAKRNKNKKKLAGKWEFGCGQLEIDKKIETCIQKSYQEDFNAVLDFFNDRAIPIISYTFKIEEEDRIVPGILFLARINNPEEIKNNSHEQIKWINPQDLGNLTEEECVGDFHDSANRAFEMIEGFIHS